MDTRCSNYPVAPDAETYEAVAKSYLDVYINTGFEDQNDPRVYSDAQVETRLLAFIESMEPIDEVRP